MSITYEIEGSEQVLDGTTILSWLTINDDLSVTVDSDMAASYAQQLASKYNTYAATRSFETTAGDTVKICGGDYGWVINKKGEAAQIVEDIKNGESVTREPKYEQRAFVEGADDIGNTYIEIDYTNQHLWYYKDGSPCGRIQILFRVILITAMVHRTVFSRLSADRVRRH